MSGFLMSLINPIIDILKERLVRHVFYTIQVGDNVESMSTRAEILKAKLEDINDKIANDDREMKKPTVEVKEWVERVEALVKTIESVKSDYAKRNCLLFGGTCSFDCLANHSLSTTAIKQLAEVETELKNYGDIKEVTVKVGLPPVQLMSTTPIKFGQEEFEARLREAINFLDNEQEGALGLWGMGGVGKTMLLQHINNTLDQKVVDNAAKSLKFDKVIFVTASRDCTVEKLQKQIMDSLGLPNGVQIFNYLVNKSFVLLLDDLWEVVNLKEVGIPFPLGTVGQKKRKLVLATWFRHVCNNMEVRRLINVVSLSRDAARKLFRETVGGDTISSDPLIRERADIVADQCDGLPIALLAIGRSLMGNETIQVWDNAIQSLRQSKYSKIPGVSC